MSLSCGYSERIRPMLNIIEKLRKLGVKDEGIKLPTIAVSAPTVDDNTRWKGVIAKVEPNEDDGGKQLAIRVDSKLIIEYSTVKKEINADEVESAINAATVQLVGNRKDIKDHPITLTVIRAGSPELTLIDLPGITRVPIADQPKNIYEQVTRMIRHYIEPEETVILNVISATVDFSTCESIRMSQEVDQTGERTLAVVTKIDLAPDGLHDKIMENAVHELTNKLVEIQADRIARTIPKLQQQLTDLLQARQGELATLPRGISTEAEAGSMLFRLVADRKAILDRLLIEGDYTEEPGELFHAAAAMHRMFIEYQAQLASSKGNQESILKLHDHILGLMRSCRGANLPDFLPMRVLRQLVKEQVEKNADICEKLVPRVYKYAHHVASHVEGKIMESYPQLCAKAKALATEVLGEAKQHSMDFVKRLLHMEANMITMNDASYMQAVQAYRESFPNPPLADSRDGSMDWVTAREMQLRLYAYWPSVQQRLAELVWMEVKYSVQQALLTTVDYRVLQLPGMEKQKVISLMHETPAVHRKRESLIRRIEMLKKGNELVVTLPKLFASLTEA
ncbi:hypothetical protein CBR_g694 [Chara braunii]|uniref:GED domain-containing protein n=1 Tax=Chara braunii TaxID=69332 RepID=A0A388KBX7_CHABU|nr:hypothetical protein CBR_g694 [Chara braunii]|eukprot:GBG67565.1 hypothetical protein CBR_g694 [Chara braunii]